MLISEFKALGENVLLEVLFGEVEEKTASGIIIPQTVKEKEDVHCMHAIVHAVGPKVDQEDINIGDKVLFINFGVHPVNVEFEDSVDGVFCLVPQVNICAVIDDDEDL